MDGDLIRGLRSRAIDVVMAADAGMIRRRDEEHLDLATTQGRALYSFNIRDYYAIHANWTATGRSHAGISLSQQKRYSTGEQIRRLLRLIGSDCRRDEEPGEISRPLVKTVASRSRDESRRLCPITALEMEATLLLRWTLGGMKNQEPIREEPL